MILETKFDIKDYVKIIPLDDFLGRVIGIHYDGLDVVYKIEFYASFTQNEIIVYEDEIELIS